MNFTFDSVVKLIRNKIPVTLITKVKKKGPYEIMVALHSYYLIRAQSFTMTKDAKALYAY